MGALPVSQAGVRVKRLPHGAGLPLPGETTLVATALYAGATGQLSIAVVVTAAVAGAILGAWH